VDLQGEKSALRRAVIGRLRSLGSDDRLRRSAAVLERLEAADAWADAAEVLAFHPLPEEVALLPLLERVLASGRGLWLPRISGTSLAFHRVSGLNSGLERHGFGMEEPRADLPVFTPSGARGAILVLTPGLAFDRELNRLGRGRGYYDRFLRALRLAPAHRVRAVAVAFSVQLVDSVPHGPGDEPVDAVVTDLEVVRAPRP
jgi:5-formyltetrahydrofolate cyclo-ligase